MSPLIRKSLFLVFVVIFVLSGAIIISYSLGWKLDFDPPAGKFVFQKTGALNIKTSPKDVIIKINGKTYSDQSGLLQSGTLISGLFPKTYKLEVKKKGYLPYTKNISIEPALVSKFLSIVLWPEKITPEAVTPVKGTEIIDSSENGDKFIVKNLKTATFYLYDLNNASSTFNLTHAFNNGSKNSTIKNIYFVPFKNSRFVIEDNSSLKIMDTETGTAELITKTPLLWTLENSNVYFIKQSPVTENASSTKTFSIYSYSLIFKNTSQIIQLPQDIAVASITDIKSSSSNNKLAFLQNSGNLYIVNQNKIQKISDSTKFFEFSPDDKKIAFIDKNDSLNIYFLENDNLNSIKNSGDNDRINLENKQNISDIKWYEDSNHLLVYFADKQDVKITEIDPRSNLNIYPVISDIENFYYNSKNNAFYFIKGSILNKINFNN